MKNKLPRDRLRICHVQTSSMLTGAQRVMLEIFKQLDPQRFTLHVACREAAPLTAELEALDIEYHLVPALRESYSPLSDWFATRQLRELFSRQKFDLVHTHSWKAGQLCGLVAREAGVNAVVHHAQG